MSVTRHGRGSSLVLPKFRLWSKLAIVTAGRGRGRACSRPEPVTAASSAAPWSCCADSRSTSTRAPRAHVRGDDTAHVAVPTMPAPTWPFRRCRRRRPSDLRARVRRPTSRSTPDVAAHGDPAAPRAESCRTISDAIGASPVGRPLAASSLSADPVAAAALTTPDRLARSRHTGRRAGWPPTPRPHDVALQTPVGRTRVRSPRARDESDPVRGLWQSRRSTPPRSWNAPRRRGWCDEVVA